MHEPCYGCATVTHVRCFVMGSPSACHFPNRARVNHLSPSFQSLPDQHHRYFINGVAGGLLDEPGVMLSRIPFSHPVHVPKILSLLRQQLLFNSVLASCVRPGAKKGTWEESGLAIAGSLPWCFESWVACFCWLCASWCLER